MGKKQKIGLGLALLVFVTTIFIAMFVPSFAGLTDAGIATIAITIFFLILLVTEALPLSVASLLTVGVMPLFGVVPGFSGAVSGFAHPVIFFIIASFGIAAAIMHVPITKRILHFILTRTNGKTHKILLALMVTTAGVSFFMSNVPACAIMMGIALTLVDTMDDGKEKKRMGKTLMIAVPVATMIGGVATPASSSLNLLAISLLEQHTGYTITFVEWMSIGVPFVIFMIPLAWLIMLKVYKPPQIDKSKIDIYMQNLKKEIGTSIKLQEVMVVVIVLIMMGLWISSSWVDGIEVFTVALLGCVLFFMPPVNVLDWKKFVPTINWDIIFISGTILSIAAALVANGVDVWLAGYLQFGGAISSASVAVGLAAIVAFLTLLFVTSAPALITLLAAPLIGIALAAGVPPGFLMIALAFCAGNCYLFPLDTVQLLTYSKGYYKMTDMSRSTLFLQIIIVIVLALWVPFMGSILGL